MRRAMSPDGGPKHQLHPILIRTQSDPAQVIRTLDSVISSIDPDLVATSSTLEEMLRRSPPFIVSSLAAAVASTTAAAVASPAVERRAPAPVRGVAVVAPLGSGAVQIRIARRTEARNVVNACAELDYAADISHVTNVAEILDLGAMRTPAVVIDGEVVISGRVPSVSELKSILETRWL